MKIKKKKKRFITSVFSEWFSTIKSDTLPPHTFGVMVTP